MLIWSTVAASSAIRMGWERGKTLTARPMRTRDVRAAIALARMSGAEAIDGMPAPNASRGRKVSLRYTDAVEPTSVGCLHQGENLLKGFLLCPPVAIVAFHDNP